MAAKNSRARMQNPTCKYNISKEAESTVEAIKI